MSLPPPSYCVSLHVELCHKLVFTSSFYTSENSYDINYNFFIWIYYVHNLVFSPGSLLHWSCCIMLFTMWKCLILFKKLFSMTWNTINQHHFCFIKDIYIEIWSTNAHKSKNMIVIRHTCTLLQLYFSHYCALNMIYCSIVGHITVWIIFSMYLNFIISSLSYSGNWIVHVSQNR